MDVAKLLEELTSLTSSVPEEPEAVEVPFDNDVANVNITNSGVLDAELARKIRMTQVITKFASTLTLRPIKVSVVNNSDPHYQHTAPAWSDSDNIWFNENELGSLTDPTTVLSLKGLSLHEIAHILLTPRTGSNLAKEVQREGLWRAFNSLEDQRIEMMMTKRFGNVSDWLAATVSMFLMDNPQQWGLAFPLVYGRKYLPQEMRTQVASLYEDQHNVRRIGQLIDQYLVLNLVDPNNYSTALDIIREYSSLVDQLDEQPNPQGWGPPQSGWDRVDDPSGHSHRKNGEWKSSSSKPMKKAEQEKLAQRVQADVDNDDTLDNFGDSSPSEQQGDPSEGGSAGGQGTAGAKRDLSAMANDIVKDVLNRKAKDISNTLKQYGADVELSSNGAGALSNMDTRLEAVEPDAVQASKSFANELERLRSDFDPGWNRRVESGKLNIQRYVTGSDLDECFDEWDMGREDAVDIEAVILLDISGSMQSNSRGAFQSMWAIKRALDKVAANTTVIAFDDDAFTLYSANERATAQMKYGYCRGGTNPAKALKKAKDILANSNRAIKLCITITDGEWYGAESSETILREFRNAGVLTALAYIEDDWGRKYRTSALEINSHGCEIAVKVDEMSDLFNLGRSMVKLGIARNLVNAGA